MLGQLTAVARFSLWLYDWHNLKTNCWPWNCLMVISNMFVLECSWFSEHCGYIGTLGKRPILYVTVWESAGAEWRCGSVGLLRLLCSVLYC